MSDDYSTSKDDKIYTLKIDIEIHTSNEKNTAGNNNILDDILISYYGKISDLNDTFLNSKYVKNSESCLGKDC